MKTIKGEDIMIKVTRIIRNTLIINDLCKNRGGGGGGGG